MLSEDLRGLGAAVGELAGKVGEREWSILNGIRTNMLAIADDVKILENLPFVQEGDAQGVASQ